MRIGITCYPTYGGSGVVATELGIELAATGHEVHFISYSQPFRLSGRDNGIFYHEVPVSSYPLFEFPPYDLALASRMAEVAEFNAPRPAARPLRDSPLSERDAGTADAGGKGAATAVCDHAAWHGYYAGGTGPKLSADHAFLHSGERWGYLLFPTI